MNPYLLLIGAFAFWYVPGAIALYKMQWNVTDFKVIAIRETYIDVSLVLKVKNVTSTNLNIKSLDVSVYLDSFEVSQIVANNVLLRANSTENVGAIIRLTPEKIGKSVWSALISKNFQDSVFTFKGIARANGRPYPFATSLTVKEFIDYNS